MASDRRRTGADGSGCRWVRVLVAVVVIAGSACSSLEELPVDEAGPTSVAPGGDGTTTTASPAPVADGSGDRGGASEAPAEDGADEGGQPWQRCSNDVDGWQAQYPPGWYTNGGEQVPACRLFDTEPIELFAAPSEVPPDIAIQLRVEPSAELAEAGDDPAVEVLDRRPVAVDGWLGERREERHTGTGAYPEGSRSVRYVLDLASAVLLASTTEVGGGDFPAQVEVLDQIVGRLELAEPDPDAVRAALPQDSVALFFAPGAGGQVGCTSIRPVRRPARWPTVLRSAVVSLLQGPSPAEREAGLVSPFSGATAGGLRSVLVDDGVAHVDLAPFSAELADPTECDRAMLFAQLDATVTQFAEVERAVYSFDGDQEAFYRWVGVELPAGG